MTKIFAIATSLLMLFQSTNIHFNDLMELDDLMEHYEFHAAEYGDNFMVFLSKHYGELKAEHSKNHQEEQQEHDDLPFQHNCHSLSLVVFIANEAFDYTSRPVVSLNQSGNFHYTALYTMPWSDGPFQPPKQA